MEGNVKGQGRYSEGASWASLSPFYDLGMQ